VARGQCRSGAVMRLLLPTFGADIRQGSRALRRPRSVDTPVDCGGEPHVVTVDVLVSSDVMTVVVSEVRRAATKHCADEPEHAQRQAARRLRTSRLPLSPHGHPSGNVVFDSPSRDVEALEARIEAAWPEQLGFHGTMPLAAITSRSRSG
jgi:hypothetical protein